MPAQTEFVFNKQHNALHNLLSQFKLTYQDNIQVIFNKIKVDEVVDFNVT